MVVGGEGSRQQAAGSRQQAAGSDSTWRHRTKAKHGLVHLKKGKSTNASRNWGVLLRNAASSLRGGTRDGYLSLQHKKTNKIKRRAREIKIYLTWWLEGRAAGTAAGSRQQAAGSDSTWRHRTKAKHGLVHWKKGKSTNASRNWGVLQVRRAARSLRGGTRDGYLSLQHKKTNKIKRRAREIKIYLTWWLEGRAADSRQQAAGSRTAAPGDTELKQNMD